MITDASNELKPDYVLITDSITERFPSTLKALIKFIRTLKLYSAFPETASAFLLTNMKRICFPFKRKQSLRILFDYIFN